MSRASLAFSVLRHAILFALLAAAFAMTTVVLPMLYIPLPWGFLATIVAIGAWAGAATAIFDRKTDHV